MAGWIAAVIASTVLNGICQGLILTGLVWLALRLLPKAGATTRHAVWSLALVLVTALPFIEAHAPTAINHPGIAAPVPSGSPAAAITLPAAGHNWILWLLGAWAVISLVLLGRVARSYVALQRLKARAIPVPASCHARFDELQRACPGRRRASLLASEEISAPMAAGLRSPAVLVPASVLHHLAETELDDVLTHELAHLRRWDDWTNLAQRIIEAVYFFHPAVLWIGLRLDLEREIACDDWVVALTGAPRPYAACLTKLAAMSPARSPQLAPGAVARKPQISIRVEALLAKTAKGTARLSKAGLVLASGMLALAGIAALPLAPVAVADLPVPALAPPVRAASVPTIAYVAPKPPSPARPARMPQLARVRRPATTPDFPALQEAVTVQEPVAAYYVISVDGPEGGFIQVFWFRVPRGMPLSQI